MVTALKAIDEVAHALEFLAIGCRMPLGSPAWRCTLLTERPNRSVDARPAEALRRVALIVSPTAQAQIHNRILTSHCHRLDMVELETPPRTAPPPIGRDVAALLPVSQKNRAPDRARIATLPFRIGQRLWVHSRLVWSRRGKIGFRPSLSRRS
jgi:hypothetical protein